MKNQKLTKLQFNELEKLHNNGDRSGYYVKYYEFIGSAQSLQMAQISSFSDLIGGTAEMANKILANKERYPSEGVIAFSNYISSAHFNAIRNDFNNGGTGVLSDSNFLGIAKNVWEEKRLGRYFPGNPKLALKLLQEGDFKKAFNDLEGIVKGGAAGIAGGFFHTVTLGAFSGKSGIGFIGSMDKYETRVTPDFQVRSFIDKSTGHTVYVQITDAVKIMDSYIVKGMDIESVAASYNVPVSWVQEDFANNVDSLGRPQVLQSFLITPILAQSNGFSNIPWPSVNPTTPSNMPSYWAKNKQEAIDKTTKSNNELLSKFTSPTGGPSGPDDGGGDDNLFSTKPPTSNPTPGPSLNPSNEPLFKPTPVVQKTHNGFTNQPWNEAPSPIPTLNGFSNTPWSIFPSSKPNFDSNIPSSQPFLNIPSLSPSLFSSNPKPASNPFSNFPWNKPTSSSFDRGYSFDPFGGFNTRSGPLFFSPKRSGTSSEKIPDQGWLYQPKNHFIEMLEIQSKAKSILTNLMMDCAMGKICGDYRSLVGEALHKAGASASLAIVTIPFKDIKLTAIMVAYLTSKPNKWLIAVCKELGVAIRHVSPLVLDLDCDGIELFPYTEGVYFDIDNDGYAEKIGWTRPDDGQLARDINGNGKIDDITELFGDDLISAFFKLSLLDSNDDKVIDSRDEKFDELLVWQDKNSNGFSEADELKTLKEMGITSISLKTTADNRNIEGNLISETSRFTYNYIRTCEIADVHYHNDDTDTWYKGKAKPGKQDLSAYQKEIKQFRNIVFKAIKAKIKNTEDFSKSGDWLAKLITAQAEKFITKVTKEKEDKAKDTENLAQELVSKKALESHEKHEHLREFLMTKMNELEVGLKEEAQTALSEELNISLMKEKETIQSKFIQEINKKSEEVLKIAQQNRWSQAQFDQEMEQYTKAIEINFDLEIASVQQKYTKIFAEKMDAIIKDISDIVEKMHLNQQLSGQEVEGLVKLIRDQNEKYKLFIDKYIETVSKIIKEAADIIYKFVIEEASFIKDEARKIEENGRFPENETEELEANQEQSYYDYFASFFQKKELINREFFITKANQFLNENYFATKQNTNNSTENNNQYEEIEIDPETLFMPMMRGYGKIPSLHIAMSLDPILKADILDFILIKPSELNLLQNKVMNILYQWAGVKIIHKDAQSTAAGGNIEARKVAFVEAITGQEFKQLGAAKFVGQHASTSVQKAWDIALIHATENLLIQGPFMPLFPKATYSFIDDQISLNSDINEILAIAKEYADKNSLGYDFWVQLGYILAPHIEELNISIEDLRTRLSALAGEEILVSLDPFSLMGDDKNNHIKGTYGSDYINGLNGNDKLEGFDGSDYIDGADGDDEIYGGDGIDRLYGGNGNDKIYGGRDRDFIYGGDGNDSIYGEEGDDIIEGGLGADFMDGGIGENTLSYGESTGGVNINLATGEASGFDAEGDQFKNFKHLGGSEYDDVLIGDDQDNDINGEGGNDKIYGGKGNDNLFGAIGEDYLYGEEGDDTLAGFEGVDHMDGGEGVDTVDYYHPYSTIGVKVDLSTGKGVGGYAHGDTYINIENVQGSKFDDVIIGDDKNNKLFGNEGDDEIYGGGGNDIIIDLYGHNILYGDDGDDLIISGGNNVCFGGSGTDTISYQALSVGINVDMNTGITIIDIIHKEKFSEFENVIGTDFDDNITGDDKDNRIDSGDGDDKVFSGKGNDYIMGGLGADFYDGGEGKDIVDYSNEPDQALYFNLKTKTLTGAIFALGDTLKNIEGVVGTKFNDILIGDEQDNQLFGYDGDDEIHGGDGNDYISGGKGKNKLYGDDGGDVFGIGEGENLVYGGTGTNTVTYSSANASVEVDLSKKQGKKSTGEVDIFEDIHNCYGSSYNDIIIGDNGLNHLNGLDGDDYIDGGGGSDTIDGGNGNNTLLGGCGNDRFLLVDGSNIVDGGSDIDTASYAAYLGSDYLDAFTSEYYIRKRIDLLPSFSGQEFADPIIAQTKGVIVNLATGIVEKLNGLKDTLTNIENIEGTHYDDIITGDDNDNVLNGNNGEDIIYGGKGNDIISSGRGHSELHGDEGNDIFKITIGTADIYGGEGQDAASFNDYTAAIEVNMEKGTISYKEKPDCKFEEVEAVDATPFNDIVYDSRGDNHIKTEAGDDIIYVSDGNDIIEAGSGDDVIYLNGSGEKIILGDSGADKYVIMPGFASNGKTSVVIGDFAVNWDRIDLTHLSNITSFSNLKFEQIEVIEGADSYSYAVVHIEDNKEIALLGVELSKLNSDNFIFHD